MRKSLVYFIVMLIVCSLTFTLIPTGISQTENVKIVSSSWYIDLLGYLVVVGEIQNIGQNTLNQVIVHGTVTTSEGDPTEYVDAAWVSQMIPNQKAPFYLVFYSTKNIDGTWPGGDVAKVDLKISQADPTPNYQYADLKITSQTQTIGSGTDDKGVFWVRGTIQNIGSQTARNVSVVATFYNASGTAIGAGHTYTETVIPNILAPQQTASFEVAAFDLDQTLVPSNLKIEKYSLLVQVIGPLLQGSAPVIQPTPTPVPVTTGIPSDTTSPTNSQTSTQPTDSNTSGSATADWILPAVIIIVIVAAVGALLAITSRKPKTKSQTAKKKK
jgi:hypothetical protein